MNPEDQNQTPEQNVGEMPQAPAPEAPQDGGMPPVPEAPAPEETPEVPAGGAPAGEGEGEDAPEVPAPDDEDKKDGANW